MMGEQNFEYGGWRRGEEEALENKTYETGSNKRRFEDRMEDETEECIGSEKRRVIQIQTNP